jgi:uncharacterized membrane protein HdeD (DUF308 family)
MFFQHWWTVALRGLFALALGVGMFVWPGMTLAALARLFGAYAMADGILAVNGALWAARWEMRWWPFLAEGGVGIAVGVVTLIWQDVPLFGLLYVIAVWAFLTGVFEIVAAALVWRVMAGVWLLALSGVGSLLLGALLVAFPGAGVLAVVWLIAAYAVAFGVLLLRIALQMRPWEHRRAVGKSAR